MGLYRDIGEWKEADTVTTVVAAQVSLSPGRDRHNFFSHRHSVIAKIFLEKFQTKNNKKKEHLSSPGWTKRNSLWFKRLDFSYVLAEGPVWEVMGDALMALRPFGASCKDPPGCLSKCSCHSSGIHRATPRWSRLQAPASCHVCCAACYTSASWCCCCHEICPSLMTLWQPLSRYLIYVYNVINTFLLISAVSTSSWFVGSLMFLKYFGKTRGQSGVISGFVLKKTPKHRLFIHFLVFLEEDAKGHVNHSAISSQKDWRN